MALAIPVKAAYWLSTSEFPAERIDFTLFNHLFCAFADLDPTTNQVTITPEKQVQFSSFTRMVKDKDPSVKTLLSIGGAEAVPGSFAAMVGNESNRKLFIDSSIALARDRSNYSFDGLDLNWEFPNTPEEVLNLGLLLQEWRRAVDDDGTKRGEAKLLLTAATASSAQEINQWNYPTGNIISTNLNWINVKAYDFYGPRWFPKQTAPPAPLLNRTEGQRCVSAGINAWVRRGVPREKLVVGLPFYGRVWKLTDAQHHGLFAPADGRAVGQHIDQGGAIAYNQLITRVGFETASEDRDYVTEYCYSGTTWIGYDGDNSITKKVQYAQGEGLRGYFAWQVSEDNNWILSRAASEAWGA